VERGPNWIHGTRNNPIYDLVLQTGTPTHSFGDIHVTFAPDGSRLPDDLVHDCAEVMWDIVGDAMKYSNKHADSNHIPAHQSLMDYFKQEVPLRIPGNSIRHHSTNSKRAVEYDIKKRRETVLQMASLWGAYIGSTTERQSLRFLWLEECLDGENLFCAGTYQKVLDAVAEPAKKGADLRFGCKVTRIGSKDQTGEGQVQITVESGEEFWFDEVVVTTPLGWLKKNKEAFEPPLPERFDKAIEELGYGNLDKVRINVTLDDP
jgi:hypothetical protein